MAESECKLAHRYAKALWRVEAKLRICRNLQDPLHDQKKGCRKRVEMLQEKLRKANEAETPAHLQNHHWQTLLLEQQKLEQFNQMPEPAASSPQSSAVQDVLVKLLNQTVAKFTLVIAEDEGIYCVCQ